jgi:hypothetical protein
MKSSANSVEEYIQGLSEERKIAVSRIREAVLSSNCQKVLQNKFLTVPLGM